MLRSIRTLRLNRRAIIYGYFTDLGVSWAWGIILGLFTIANNPDPASLQRIRESLGQSTDLVVLAFILGLAATALGGYVAARKAPRAELANALAVGILVTAVTLLRVALFGSRLELPISILGMALTPPVALIGGFLRLFQLERFPATGAADALLDFGTLDEFRGGVAELLNTTLVLTSGRRVKVLYLAWAQLPEVYRQAGLAIVRETAMAEMAAHPETPIHFEFSEVSDDLAALMDGLQRQHAQLSYAQVDMDTEA